MSVMRTDRKYRRREAGFSLIEIMIGLVIGLIATAIILQTFAVSEGFKRNTTGAGDAQQNGLFSTFTLALELANAGNGIAASAVELATCPRKVDDPTVKPENTLRPIPVFVTDGGNASTPDSFIVNYSVSNTLVYPSLFIAPAPAGSAYQVQSPGGYKVGDMIIAISQAGQCEWSRVTNVTAPDANGVVTITHKGAAGAGAKQAFPDSALLFNMGPWDRVQRVRYDVVNGVLRSTNLLPPDPGVAPADPPVPIASNIVNMKVQYGIDNNADGILDTWVGEPNAPWTARGVSVLDATREEINVVKAMRIGFIVRSMQYDRGITADFNWVLFDCETHDNACPGRLTGIIPADVNGGGYRYRIYETVVPLRNQLWNKQL